MQPFADLALVVVHFRRVDMTVAEPQRLLGDARAGAPAQVPGTETDEWDTGALRADDMSFGGRHRAPHLPSASLRKPSRNSARRAVSRLLQNAPIGEAMVPW